MTVIAGTILAMIIRLKVRHSETLENEIDNTQEPFSKDKTLPRRSAGYRRAN